MQYNNIKEFLHDIRERMDEIQSQEASQMDIHFSTSISASRGEPFDSVDAMEEMILEALGAQGFLDALTRALDYDTKEDMYKYIIDTYELDIPEEG